MWRVSGMSPSTCALAGFSNVISALTPEPALNLFDGRVRGQRVLFELADDLVHHVAEQVGPAEMPPVVSMISKSSRPSSWMPPASARIWPQLPAMRKSIRRGVGRAVGMVTVSVPRNRREQVLHAAHEVGEPADVRLELGLVSSIMAASKPMPAMMRKTGRGRPRGGRAGETAHVHRAGRPWVATVSAASISSTGTPILRANRLPVPMG